jgi:hypothetical protein
VRWVGIDEAGYGPNLGPMVITAVIAEDSSSDRRPDLWADLPLTVRRAGDGDAPPDRLWVDDSKAILRGGIGREHLETTCLATLAATSQDVPRSLGGLLQQLGAGTLADVELAHWCDGDDLELPRTSGRSALDRILALRPLSGASWRIVGVRSVLVGPARFNEGLACCGSKAGVHFAAFAPLLQGLWHLASDGQTTHVRSDKHGGRHYYLDLLCGAFPSVWIDRGPEGPELSRYTIRDADRRLELALSPRADGQDGLVALASIVSKTVRELWMDVFNTHWTARIPDLRPTAGYPNDASRFRKAIESDCRARGLDAALWWRDR